MNKNQSKQILAWSLYDFANTSFTVVVITVIFPVYFKKVICDIQNFEFLSIQFLNASDFFWGVANSVSFLIVALTAPILGAMSDLSSRKKKYIFYYTLLCIISTILIYQLENGDILFAIILLILGNIGFETAIIFYDAFLPIIASEDKLSQYSGYGFAAGYLGAIISLLVAIYFSEKDMINEVFLFSAAFFSISSLPFFLYVKEEKKERIATFSYAVKNSLSQVLNTIKNINNHETIRRFLISFFFYMNGIMTVISFGGIYADGTLKMAMTEIIIFFAIVQFSAMCGSFLFGYLGQKYGDLRILLIIISLWIIVCILAFASAYVSFKKELFYGVGVLSGLGLGSCQSLSRSFYSRLVPKGNEAEYFGFYSLCGRFAAILGPFLFGIVSSLTGDQTIAVLSILSFFIIGIIYLPKVKLTLK